MRWNEKDYFETLDDKLLRDQLNEECQKVLDKDKNMLEKCRRHSKKVEVRILRNIPGGHILVKRQNIYQKADYIQSINEMFTQHRLHFF